MLAFGRSVLAGAATLALLVLPVVILLIARSVTGRIAITAGGVLRARCYEVANRLVLGATSGVSWNPHRDDPCIVPRNFGNGSFDHDWSVDVCTICTRRNLVAVHGAPDSGV